MELQGFMERQKIPSYFLNVTKVLMAVMPSDGIKIFNFMEDFKKHLTSHDKEHLMKQFLSAIINLCQTLLKEDGTPRNTLPNK